MIHPTRLRVGDLIRYKFGKSVFVGIVMTHEKATSLDGRFGIVRIDLLEVNGRTSTWDLYEIDSDHLELLARSP